MMKKSAKIYVVVFLLLSGMLASGPAQAQLVAGVSVDGVGDTTQAGKTPTDSIKTKMEGLIKEVSEELGELKAKLAEYVGKLVKVFSKIPGTKDFDDSTQVDIYDGEAVKKVFTELFLQYPASDLQTKRRYEMKAQQFYYDTLIEIKTALTGLEDQLATLRAEVEQFGDKATSGGSGDENVAGSEDENGNYYNAYMANRKFNEILKIAEELVAMQNQYYAARLLRQPQIVTPAEYEEEEESTDSTKKTSAILFHERVIFAQLLNSTTGDTSTSTLISSDSASASGTSSTATTTKSSSKTTFVVPAAPKTSSLLEGYDTELEALKRIADIKTTVDQAIRTHNIMQQMPTYRDLYKQYVLYLKLHEKADESVKNVDKCVIKYIGRHYDSPNNVWFGQATEPSDTCDYDSRQGLSAWAITAYQTANAAIEDNLDIDSFATVSIDPSLDSGLITTGEDVQISSVIGVDSDSAYSPPSKSEEFSNTVRENELLTWEIGRKAAQLLVADQYSENPVYGKASNPFPLWNDQKNFYNQYLNGKYGNMKTYINRLDLSSIAMEVAELLNNGLDDDEKAGNASGLNKIQKELSKNADSQSSDITLLSEKAEALQAVNDKMNAALAPYEAKLTQLNQDLDAWAELLDRINQKISDQEQENLLNQSKMQVAEDQIELISNRGDGSGVNSSTYAEAKYNLEEAGEAYASGIKTLGELRVTASKYESQRDSVQAQITALEEQIDGIKQSYQEEIVAVENEYDDKISAAQSSLADVMTLSKAYSSLNLHGSSLRKVVSRTDDLIAKTRSCANTLIDNHLDSLLSTGDSLYLPSGNKAVVTAHTQLIENLKSLPRDCLITEVESATNLLSVSPDKVVSLLRSAIKSAISKAICANYACDSADSQYFVGLPAKARDFTAPRAALTAHYPPIRDMVHLDTTDYKKIEMTSDGKVNRSAFLEYGITQPYVWQLMLSDKAFIEQGVDLSAVLDLGGEGKAFMRGAMLPCNYKQYIIDILSAAKYEVVDVNDTNKTENLKKQQTLDNCVGLKINGRVPGIAYVIDTYLIEDTEADNDKVVKGNAIGAISNPTNSELGMFLRYKNGSLRIADRPYDGFSRIIKRETEAEKNGKTTFTAEDSMYARTMFNKNQIGDFLHFVDKEKQVKKSIDEIEISIEELKESLQEIFEPMGFVLKDNLNLADDSDYNYVLNKLKERKNTLTGEAGSDLGTIDDSNSVVKERYDKVNNLYKALLQDSKALVNISDNTEAGDSLDESIKTEETNQKVIEKARNEAYSAIQDEINNYEQPVCMPY